MAVSNLVPAATGPTLAEITTAITTNAAPASVTMSAIASSITANAAPASVTNASIASAVATNAPSPNNWALLGTATVNSTTNTYTFSGLSGYRTYKIVTAPIMLSGSTGNVAIRINGDTNFNYANGGAGATTQNTFVAENGFFLRNPGTNPFQFNAEIQQANNSGNKSITAQVNLSNVGDGVKFDGSYSTTSPLNSITIVNLASGVFAVANATANLIHLYGAN